MSGRIDYNTKCNVYSYVYFANDPCRHSEFLDIVRPFVCKVYNVSYAERQKLTIIEIKWYALYSYAIS